MARIVTRRVALSTAATATGVTVVIDVLRAFTVAAYALVGGAERLLLVRTVEEALALRATLSEGADARGGGPLLAGEVGGRLIPGFDLNNSPARMASADVRGRTILQRTGAGTQGAVGARNASPLLVASLVNARATAARAALLAGDGGTVTLLPTNEGRDLPGEDAASATWIEDAVCADYLEALLQGRDDARTVLDDGLARLHASGRLAAFATPHPDFPPEDIPLVLAVDRFAFAMEGTRLRLGGVECVEVRRVDV